MDALSFNPMRRVLVACCVLGVCVGRSSIGGAGATRKIDIDSDPAGAAVYLNDVDSGTACEATPCTIEAPIGTTTIILRKDGYTPDIAEITVPRRGKVKPFKSTLTSEVGTLVATDPTFKGGKLFVDDIDKGATPQRLELQAGPHHAQVVVKGRPVADDILELDAGTEHELKPTASAPMPPAVSDSGTKTPSFDEDGEGEAKPEGATKIKATASTSSPRRPYINVGADFDVGFRQFSYDNPGTGLSPTESEVGQAMIGPTLELWPMELIGANHLRGLSLFGKVEFGLNHQVVLDDSNMAVGPKTFWGNIEVDLRHRWLVGDASSITIEGGFVRDQLQFQAASKMDLLKVPYVDYRSIEFGVRAATHAGSLEPFAALEGRIVMSGGDLGTRFASADTTGGRVAVGASLAAGPVYLRAQAALTVYSWTFTNSAAGAGTADGATDLIEVLSFVVGLSH